MLDINKAAERMEELNNTKKMFGNYPLKNGENRLRIVRNKERPDWPFNEVLIYWGLTKGMLISPASYGEQDPVKNELDKLRKGSQQDKQIVSSIYPKARIFAPVLVRGEEDKGVVWIDFPRKVYKDILNLITDEEWGDMTDPKKGYDIVIRKDQIAGQFPQYSVVPKQISKLAPTDAEIKELQENQPLFRDVFNHPTKEQLEEYWENYLNGTDSSSDDVVEEIHEEGEVDLEKTLARFKDKFNTAKKK